MTRLILALLVTVALTLAGCGDDELTVSQSKGDGQDAGLKSGTLDRSKKIGLRDPSPLVGREVRGPITYAYKTAPEGSKPKEGGEVVFGILEDIESFNPFLSSSSTASEVHDQIFARLMNEQPDYYDGVPTFKPQIAESWVIAEDNLSIRFKLRDCTWSDGTPITARDIQFSVSAAQDSDVAWLSSSIAEHIARVEIHSDRDFTVHYTKAQPYNIMDINDVQVIPKHTFGTVPFGQWHGYDGWPALAKQAAGGPWMLGKHDPGQSIVLVPNPKYWDAPKPYLDRLVFRIFGNTDSELIALLAGQLDVMQGVIPEKAKRVLATEHLNLYTYVTRSYGYLGWNCKRFPFDDKRARQAMTYAINRHNIVESLFAGYASVAGPGIIRSMWASNQDIKPFPYDPDKASALLAEAGWKKNADGWLERKGEVFEFKLKWPQGSTVRKTMCEYIQADLKRIGVKAVLDPTDVNQLSQQLKKHKFQACNYGWNVATKIDPKSTFHSVSTNGRHNYVNFENAAVDKLIDQGRTMNILVPAIRLEAKKVWDRFQEILDDEQPYTMMYEPRGLVGIDKKFVNVRVTSLRALDNVHEWWIE